MERQEYTAETYPSFGKKYNGEKAIISLTSWRARINTVAKTIYSLIKQCPGFHIVLVLSEEEFPKMMNELPENLMLFVENELIEVLWVYKNYKSFKKVLFTMDKYRDVPVISADDDCVYKFNYAEELYETWKNNKNCLVTYRHGKYKNICHQWGAATLHPPYFYGKFGLEFLNKTIIETNLDDGYYLILRDKFNLSNYIMINKDLFRNVLTFHTNAFAISSIYSKNNMCDRALKLFDKIIEYLKNNQ